MNKKNSILIIIALILGLLLGKFVFQSPGKIASENPKKENIHQNETAVEHWTCSMHPQIDMPEPGQCPICGMDLIPKTVQKDKSLSNDAIQLTPEAVKSARVETMILGKTSQKTKERTMVLSAKVSENENNTATQTSHVAGRIEKFYVNAKGDYVRKGQRIALIYSPDLVAAQNELLQALYIKNEQPELYKAVRQKLKYWKLTENQIQKIENTKKVIPNMPVYADFSGYITGLKANEGSHVKEGGALYDIADLSTVWVLVDIYEKDLNSLKTGQAVTIKFNAYPQKDIKAKIDYIDPDVNAKTRTATARIVLNNPGNRYKPGMLATVYAKAPANNETKNMSRFIIPKTAVLWTGKRSVVYIKLPENGPVFEMKQVVLGQPYGDQVEIISGLHAGDEIVTNGVFTIDASAQLQGKPGMMNSKSSMQKETEKKSPPKEKNNTNTMKCAQGKCGGGH